MQKHHGIIVKGVKSNEKNQNFFGSFDGCDHVRRCSAGGTGASAAGVDYGECRRSHV